MHSLWFVFLVSLTIQTEAPSPFDFANVFDNAMIDYDDIVDLYTTLFGDTQYRVHNQREKAICWAFATATIIRQAESRIFGRTRMLHADLVTKLVENYASKEWREQDMYIKQELAKRNLIYIPTTLQETSSAVTQGRHILFFFWMTTTQWQQFSNFFIDNKQTDFLKPEYLSPISKTEINEGHAVVIVGQTNDYWVCKNSWGYNFANKGFFNMAKSLDSKISVAYRDVYYTIDGLSELDKANWKSLTDAEKHEWDQLTDYKKRLKFQQEKMKKYHLN